MQKYEVRAKVSPNAISTPDRMIRPSLSLSYFSIVTPQCTPFLKMEDHIVETSEGKLPGHKGEAYKICLKKSYKNRILKVKI